MKKLEIIKETEETGRVWYLVNYDDKCISANHNLKEAQKSYNEFKKNKVDYKREVLKSEEL